MSDSGPVVGQNDVNEGKTANLIYILYLASLVLGITSLIGVIMSYINRGDAPDWVESHYQFQIRTFWIGLLMVLIGAVTSFFFVGFLILLFWVIWLIVRCAKGMKYLAQGQPHPDPETFLFG